MSVNPEGEFADGGLLGNGEGVDRLQVDSIGVAEDLLDAGDRIAVFHHHVDVVFLDDQLRQVGLGGDHQAGRVVQGAPESGNQQGR